jgi:hypothetical protein
LQLEKRQLEKEREKKRQLEREKRQFQLKMKGLEMPERASQFEESKGM